ncbi:MAG: D-alanyl-D-alanine carboxypeptidase [Lachnospiraceae bacterium]|nr:D-alanyl-D-alanine carboxypeptidase [Lachnospiraceae bacterium]
MIEQLNDEEAIRVRHRQRIEKMRQEKEKQMLYRSYFRKYAPLAAGGLMILLLILAGIGIFHKSSDENKTEIDSSVIAETDDSLDRQMAGTLIYNEGLIKALDICSVAEQLQEDRSPKVYTASSTSNTLQLGSWLSPEEEFHSNYAILIDMDEDSILAEKYARTRINPASMTKVLTVLVAAEHIENLDDTFTMTLEITDYGYIHDCSSAGFVKDEVISIKDLFYGTVLPSGADAAVGLATYVAGSQDAFVELMNEKLDQLGLSQTAHFTNCVGVYDENHYCTVYDMAMIMEAAMDNELCREVMSAHTYTTSKTEQHPEGINLSNWFLRRIEDKDCGGEVICGKTGYVVQSGSCAASYAVDHSGKHYICVSADANSQWRCISDHANLYKLFL